MQGFKQSKLELPSSADLTRDLASNNAPLAVTSTLLDSRA